MYSCINSKLGITHDEMKNDLKKILSGNFDRFANCCRAGKGRIIVGGLIAIDRGVVFRVHRGAPIP